MPEVTVAEMVAHDARVMAEQTGGTVHTSWEAFTAAIKAGEEYRRRAARPMPPEVTAQLRRLMRRLYEAIWSRDREQIDAVSAEGAPLFQEWQPQLTARVEVLNVGDFARVNGVNPGDGTPDAVTGEVADIEWTELFIGGRYQLGHVLTVRPPLPAPRCQPEYELFVPEGGSVLRLRRPRHRRRLTAPLTTTD